MNNQKAKRLKREFLTYCLDNELASRGKKYNKWRKLKKLVTRGMEESEAIQLVAEMKVSSE